MARENCPADAHIAEQGFVTPEVFKKLKENADVFIEDDGASNFYEFEVAVMNYLNDASISPQAFRPLIPELWKEARALYALSEHSRSKDAVAITETVADYMPDYNHLANLLPGQAVSSIIDGIINYSKTGTPPELDPAGRPISERVSKTTGKVHWRGIKTTDTEAAAADFMRSLQAAGVDSVKLDEINKLGIPPSVVVSYLKQMASHWEKQAIETAQLAKANPDNDVLKLNAAKAAALSTIHHVNTISNARELGRAMRQLQVVNAGINQGSNVALEYSRVFGTGRRPTEKTLPLMDTKIAMEEAKRAADEWEKRLKETTSSTTGKTVKRVRTEGMVFGDNPIPEPTRRTQSPELKRRRTLTFINSAIDKKPEVRQRVNEAGSRLRNAFSKLDAEDC